MTNGLVKGRERIFINGYAVEWFPTVFKGTKILIKVCIPGNQYIGMCEINIDYIADRYSVESIAKEKIKEIERL